MDWLETELFEDSDPIMLQGLVTHFGETSRVKETQRLHGTHLETKTFKVQNERKDMDLCSVDGQFLMLSYDVRS